MIKLNGNVIEQGRFPDGTLALKEIDLSLLSDNFINWIDWLYDGDNEMFTIMSLVDVVKRNSNSKIYLRMPYLPNARMDRIKTNTENFALKVFTNWLNNIGFDMVIVDNVHSNVSNALVNNIADYLPESDINDILPKYNFDVIFFPDEGACKRYKDMNIIKKLGLPIALVSRIEIGKQERLLVWMLWVQMLKIKMYLLLMTFVRKDILFIILVES